MSNTKKKKMTAKKRRQIQLGVLAAEVVLLIGLVIGVVVLLMNQDSISSVITKPHKTKEETESQEESKKNHALILENDKKIENPTLADVEEYWLDSCFFGDSIMYGFGSYLNYAQKGALANPTVVALVGYDLEMALSPLNKSSHPVYNGEKHTIFEVASAEQPKNIVLSFGINDLGKYGPEQFVENYSTVITMLQAICPDARIFVVSTTWVYAGRESGNRNNTNIAKMNELMEEYCRENGCGFIDVASYLLDTDTNSLFSGYTTDFFVHINNKAYDTWLALFRR